jgi:hypothetical protein
MPLLTSPREMPSGVIATFWAPILGTFDPRSREVTVRVGYYLDEAAYLSGKQPLEAPTVLPFTAPHLDAMGAPELEVTQLLYALVQTRAPFSPEPEAPAEDPAPEDPPE